MRLAMRKRIALICLRPPSLMRIALVVTPPTEHHLRLAAQIGVTDIVLRYPGLELDPILKARDHIASLGMRLTIVEGYIPHDEIVHGRANRDAQIRDFQTLIRNMGKAGVPICCYNWMPSDDWTRTSVTTPERGGALVTAFRASEEHTQATTNGIGENQLWENLEYFLERIIPVAEEAGVKMAMHPDDPPLASFMGNAQIMGSVAGFERLLNLNTSPANGMCFCQGTFAEMGVDIFKTIEQFADRIHYAHFRDVVGTAGDFRETFHDNGQTKMALAMKKYYDCGIDIPMRPDHVPTLDGEENDHPGYHMLGRLFAVGYMRGLMDAAEQRP